MGGLAGLPTQLRRARDGWVLGRAGWLAAGLWVTGVGARMAFAFAAGHGAGPAIARFSIAHQITGSGAWVAALVMMAMADVLTRLVVLFARGRRLAAAGPAIVPAPVRAGPRRSAPVPMRDLASAPAARQTVTIDQRAPMNAP